MRYWLIDEPYLPVGSGVDRTPGLHLSDILDYIDEAMGVQYGNDWNRTQTMDAGFIWERHLERTFAEAMAERIGEVERDGILMSPDGVMLDDGLANPNGQIICEPSDYPILEEYKWTWKSSRHRPWDIVRWMFQVKSYLYALDMYIAVMRIAHVMGDYKGSGPTYRVVRMEFTANELQSNWDMILRNRDALLQEGRALGTPPERVLNNYEKGEINDEDSRN